ncbi:PREDICTED: uncharacterized protein LOC105142749 isoform X2 [Populus euphratica]|uniref:Uncharacterized protein LOC105142749 isoform X2 n=1 Tax=Populus euphratica TaxID=75702 RepID=A0AAJ6VJQ6_POPEU|nr:PREDICTED: uncharacterized protein LOC105142749 isoform X2 [Populus euphratica]
MKMMVVVRRLPSTTITLTSAFSCRFTSPKFFPGQIIISSKSTPCYPRISLLATFCSASQVPDPIIEQDSSKRGPLKRGLYLVGTPIGNLEDITLRALRVLKSADVILSEDTRHSGKLLHHYNIRTPLLSYHKFNESQREQQVLRRLKEGEIVVLISDAGTPGISDPGPCAVVAALSASGLDTDEFTFVGFLSKHGPSRRERLTASANEARTQIFYVPPHKFSQFLEESSLLFGDSRRCVMAREMTKIHEEFWRGTLGEAKVRFLNQQLKGEMTLLIEGRTNCLVETPSEDQLEHELGELISRGHTLSTAVKLVAEGASVKRKTLYSLALKKFGKQPEADDNSN